MRYTPAEREDLARRKEQWILRTEEGEDSAHVRRELKLKQKVRTLAGLKPRYQTGVMAKYARLVSSAAKGAVTS